MHERMLYVEVVWIVKYGNLRLFASGLTVRFAIVAIGGDGNRGEIDGRSRLVHTVVAWNLNRSGCHVVEEVVSVGRRNVSGRVRGCERSLPLLRYLLIKKGVVRRGDVKFGSLEDERQLQWDFSPGKDVDN